MLAVARRSRGHRPAWRYLHAAAARTHYDVLGVPRNAGAAAIKLAYLRRAKSVHPDVGAGTHADFVELVQAYETLSCRSRRGQYDAELAAGRLGLREATPRGASAPGAWGAGAASAAAAAAGPREDAHQGHEGDPHEPYKPGWSPVEQRLKRKGLGYLESIRADLKEGLEMALLGPRVPEFERQGMAVMLPWAFEAEVRSDASQPHILEVLSGRQLLGFVRESATAALAGGGARLAGGHASDAEQPPAPTPTPTLELVYQGRVVALAAREGSQVRVLGVDLDELGRTTATRRTRQDKEEEEEEEEEHSHELRLLATVDCSSNLVGKAATSWLKELRSRFQMPKFSLRVPEPDEPEPTRGEGLDLAPAREPRMFRVLNADGQDAFRLVQFRTMGVTHAFYFSGEVRAARDFRIARCDMRVQRAWLPPARLWLFEPRAQGFDGGSWYFEVARPEVDEDEVLSAAEALLVSEHELQATANSAVSEHARFLWAVEKAAARKREEMGALDPRVAIMVAALASVGS